MFGSNSKGNFQGSSGDVRRALVVALILAATPATAAVRADLGPGTGYLAVRRYASCAQARPPTVSLWHLVSDTSRPRPSEPPKYMPPASNFWVSVKLMS